MSANDPGVTFVNTLLGRGIMNGVVNIQFGVCLFTDNPNTEQIDLDIVPACRLRMDIQCAKYLRDQLIALLEDVEKVSSEQRLPGEENAKTGVADAKGKPN